MSLDEERARALEATPEVLESLGFSVQIHVFGGVFAKISHLAAGSFIGKHVHDHDHMSVLVSGAGVLWRDRNPESLCDLSVVEVPASQHHEFRATAPSVWMCLWSVDGALKAEEAAAAVRLSIVQ